MASTGLQQKNRIAILPKAERWSRLVQSEWKSPHIEIFWIDELKYRVRVTFYERPGSHAR